MLRFFDNDNNDITDELTNSRLYCHNPACLGEPWCSTWGICTATEQEAKQTASLPAEEATSGCSMAYLQRKLQVGVVWPTCRGSYKWVWYGLPAEEATSGCGMAYLQRKLQSPLMSIFCSIINFWINTIYSPYLTSGKV